MSRKRACLSRAAAILLLLSGAALIALRLSPTGLSWLTARVDGAALAQNAASKDETSDLASAASFVNRVREIKGEGKSDQASSSEMKKRSPAEEQPKPPTTTTTAKTTVTDPGYTRCRSSIHYRNVSAMMHKGLAIDDTTFSQCPTKTLAFWPNTDSSLGSIRVFKAWDSSWNGLYDRKAMWKDLRDFVWQNGVRVLFGTQISCNETADDEDWAHVKELMEYIGWYYAMGLAIGNEVELIHTKVGTPADCIPRIFQQGYFSIKVMARARDLEKMHGLHDLPLTTVMSGAVLGGADFINTPEAGVADFFRFVTGKYGTRWVFTWNVYPYFEPNVQVNPADAQACKKVMDAAQTFDPTGMLATQLRELRTKTALITGRHNDVTWLGETGWSWPRATTLATPMSGCKDFSERVSFQQYYENFLKWDLSLGEGAAPIDHVFYFTMRDAYNWHLQEHFGLVGRCNSTHCKLHA